MAADLRTGERVYQEIKRAILAGDIAMHQRLDIDKLAARLGVSATPVRTALAILAVERLVKFTRSRTYQVAFWSSRELHDLYAWRLELAKWAAQSYTPTPFGNAASPRNDYVGAYLSIMRHLDANANLEARRAARAADDRLQPALRFESEVLQDPSRELSRIAAALEKGGAPLQAALRSFFRRRIAHSGEIRAAAHASAIPENGD